MFYALFFFLFAVDVDWVKTYGPNGGGEEKIYAGSETSDGGYIFVGLTDSKISHGDYDIYLIRTDSLGDTIWTRALLNEEGEWGNAVIEDTDGGFIITGCYSSYWLYIVKTDSLGNVLWSRYYPFAYIGYDIKRTQDGGYIVVGMTYYTSDVVLMKIDSVGDTLWVKYYGGSNNDIGYSVLQTVDGGYIIAGVTASFGTGYYDIYIIRTDSIGDTLWTRVYGEDYEEQARKIIKLHDGNYVLVGWQMDSLYYHKVYLLKLNDNGDTLWTRVIGSSALKGYFIEETSDNGFIISGDSSYYGYLLRTDSLGDVVWSRGWGYRQEFFRCVFPQGDGGFIIGGIAGSSALVGYNHKYDALIVRVDSLGNDEGYRTYGYMKGEDERLHSLIRMGDGGFILVGYTKSTPDQDILIVRTSSTGDSLWAKTYGDTSYNGALCITSTYDNGYLIGGYRDSGDHGYLLKIDSLGDSLWARAFNDTGREISSIVKTRDSCYLLCTSYTVFDPYYDRLLYIIKVDSSGNKLWGKSPTTGVGYAMIQTHDSLYAITGCADANGDTLLIMKMDENANPVWIKKYYGSGLHVGYSIKETSDGGFVLVSSTRLIRTDSLGDTLWTRDYSNIWGSLYKTAALHSIDFTVDSCYIIGGYIAYNNNWSNIHYKNMLIMKVTTSGDIVWYQTEGEEVDQVEDVGYMAIEGDPGNFYLVGYENSMAVLGPSGDKDGVLMKVSAPVGKREKVNTGSFRLYASTLNTYVVNIRCVLPVDTRGTLKIYDAAGRCVKTLYSGLFHKGELNIPWNLDGCKENLSGIYFVSLETEHWRDVKKIVIIR